VRPSPPSCWCESSALFLLTTPDAPPSPDWIDLIGPAPQARSEPIPGRIFTRHSTTLLETCSLSFVESPTTLKCGIGLLLPHPREGWPDYGRVAVALAVAVLLDG